MCSCDNVGAASFHVIHLGFHCLRYTIICIKCSGRLLRVILKIQKSSKYWLNTEAIENQTVKEFFTTLKIATLLFFRPRKGYFKSQVKQKLILNT